jgi:hypothetical protein
MRKVIDAMAACSTPQTHNRSTTMKIRRLFAALAVASFAAPLVAHADAPAGDINTVFAIDQNVQASVPDFDRREHRTYVEHIVGGATTASQVTREQVREELARMPPERVGA